MLKQIVKDNAKRILTKFMASTLIVTLSCTNFLVCGNYFVSYAAENNTNLDKQTDATLHKNVKFDAYFEEENNRTHYKTADLNNEEVEFVLSTHVQKEGYLKNATIDLKNEENKNDINFTVTDIEDDNAIVQSASENQLVLRQINSGDKIEFKAKISAVKNISIERLNQISLITLKGLYIDAKGKETPIEKEIKINLAWTGKYEAQIKQSITKYIPIEQADGNKALISMQIETGLKAQNTMLPIKETNLEINVPIINGERPKQVTVNAISTEATNGATSENIVFTEDNWEYSESDAKIKINIKNEENKLGKNTDIYIVNYIYSENVYTALAKGNTTINAKSNVSIKTYSADTFEECTAEANDKITLTEAIGKLISMQGENITESISKGKFYANINNPQSGDGTEFEYKWNINVGYSEGLNGIVLKDKSDRMVYANGKGEDIKTKYKQLLFNSSSFEELLGEDGKIKVYNGQEQLLGIVTKDSTTDEKGNYLIEFSVETRNVKIQISKPIKSGMLNISVKKEIDSDIDVTKQQIDNFKNVEVTSELLQLEENNIETSLEEKNVLIPLEETVTKSKISINREKLSTLVKNEDIEMTIELGNDDETSDFYIDPSFEIQLPQEVTNVEIVDAKVLFDEELTIKNVEFIQKNGVPMIKVNLDGVQTKFSNGVVANGTNIVLKVNIELNNLAPSSEQEIKMYYYNSNAQSYDNGIETEAGSAGLSTAKIEIIAPTGMITINGMQNYDGKGNTLRTLNQGDVLEQVETYRPARIIKMNISAINNTGNTCSDVVILGRIPFAGNRDLETGEDLGTTLDTYLRGYIRAENLEGDGLKIYYSENGEATSAIGDTENAWTLEPTDLSKVKSYMIVLNGYEMSQGEQINFSYDFEFPANIGYNQTINANYGIYYVNNTQVASVSAFAKSNKIGITTGRGPELSVTQNVEGVEDDGTVDSNKVLKFVINVTNTGTETATNVKIENQIPKWTSLVRSVTGNLAYQDMEIYQQGSTKEVREDWNVIKDATNEIDSTPTVGWTIEKIEPGETVQKAVYVLTQNKPDIYSYYYKYPGFTVEEDGKYYIKTQKYNVDTNETTEIKNEITDVPEIDVQNITLVEASNINATLKSTSDNIEVDNSNIKLTETISAGDSNVMYKEDTSIDIGIGISNSSSEKVQNLRYEKILPEGLEYISGYISELDESFKEKANYTAQYDETTRKITINISEIEAYSSVSGKIRVMTSELEEGTYEKEITTSAKVYLTEEKYTESDKINFTIVKPHYSVQFETTNRNPIINEGDEIEYYLKVTNIGKLLITGLNVKLFLPECFVINSATYTMLGNEMTTTPDSSGEIFVVGVIDVGENLYLKVKAKVGKVTEETYTTIYGSVSGTGIDSEMTEMISQTIEKSTSTDDGKNDDNKAPTVKKYKIGGMAWVDSNENGQRDSAEQRVEGITVVLINSITGQEVTNSNGEVIQAITEKDGSYLLTNVEAGSYLVVFKYDTNVYKTTTYRADGISEIYNSNAIEKEIKVNGQDLLAGITDTIEVNATVSNMNIGLVERNKFDLKLDKVITEITVQNKSGVKNYSFDNSKLAKVEIASSKMNGSNVVITYKIKVTNEGNVAGYAKKIVDYIPSDLKFNSNLNPNWYSGTDGNLYSEELANNIINPGETKEIKLILTKTITDTNSGISNNNAEISEDYNELGISDKDSTTGNKAQGEDDMSSADVIVTPKTGAPIIITFVMLVIMILIVIVLSITKYKTKISNKKIK